MSMMRTEDHMYTFRSPCTFAFACGEPGRGDGMRGTITVVSQARRGSAVDTASPERG